MGGSAALLHLAIEDVVHVGQLGRLYDLLVCGLPGGSTPRCSTRASSQPYFTFSCKA